MYNYVLEITSKENSQTIINLVSFLETSSLIFISFFYEYITKNSNKLEIAGIIITLVSLLFANFFFWESPKFFYNKNRFIESRESLMKIARFNGQNDNSILNEFTFKFDKEVICNKSD
jgi:hypothetical protein